MSRKRNDLNSGRDFSLPNRRRLLATVLGMTAVSLLSFGSSRAQARQVGGNPLPAKSHTKAEQEVLTLSRDKWRWMSERKADALADLFHEKAVFIHMGGSMTRKQELDTIRGGGIQYKTVDIQDASVQLMGTTAVVLNTIRLVAVVGGNEVTNPFVVTEVYVQESGKWKLAALASTRTLR